MLSDAEQRKEYDQIRAMGSGARFTAGGQGAGGFEDVFSVFGQGRGGASAVAAGLRRHLQRCSTSSRAAASAPAGSARPPAATAATAARSAAPTSPRARRSTSSPPTKGETITLQGEDGKPFKVKIPAGVVGRAEDPSARPRPPLAGRRRDGRHRRAGDGAPASGVHPRRTQPARHRAGDLHRGGARRDDRGADARRRPRQAARRPRHPVRPRAARQGPRRRRRRRAPATCSPRCRSRCRRTWTTPRAKRSSSSTSSSRRRTRAPTSCRKARGLSDDERDEARGDAMNDERIDEDAPIFAIAVAAELAGMHPQTLRQYDRLGLVVPGAHAGRIAPLLDAPHRAAARGRPALVRRHEPAGDRADHRARGRACGAARPRRATSKRAAHRAREPPRRARVRRRSDRFGHHPADRAGASAAPPTSSCGGRAWPSKPTAAQHPTIPTRPPRTDPRPPRR